MIRYFRNVSALKHDYFFSPEEHEWLASASSDEFIFVEKSTDRWTGPPHGYRRDFVLVPTLEVPVEIRRKAGQRLGAHRARPWRGLECA